mgnify:CR=1 FL=1
MERVTRRRAQNLLESFNFAFEGIIHVLRTQRNLRIHFLAAVIVLVVAVVVITLFIPCIANVFIIVKEHGWRTAAAIVAFVFPFAFAVGGLVRLLARAAGW